MFLVELPRKKAKLVEERKVEVATAVIDRACARIDREPVATCDFDDDISRVLIGQCADLVELAEIASADAEILGKNIEGGERQNCGAPFFVEKNGR